MKNLKDSRKLVAFSAIVATTLFSAVPAEAGHDYREKGKTVKINGSNMTVTPSRDWNQLDMRVGKPIEVWTLDGEQLNEVRLYGGVAPGSPLQREEDRKKAPLPKLTDTTLLAEIPELLEGTYRAARKIGTFTVTGSSPGTFLGQKGIVFSYSYVDQDGLPRLGEAQAALIDKKLYMASYDAPRLHYFRKSLDDFRGLAASARLSK